MDKIKILCLSMHYPFAISSYFLKALRNRPDIVLGGKEMLNKQIPYSMVRSQLGDWKPDMVLNIDAGTHWLVRPDVDCPVVTIATDPHVLVYDVPRGYSDYFFNMQKYYEKSGDIYMPYCYSTYDHYREPDLPIEYDAALIGLHYPNRVDLVNKLRNDGLNVFFNNGQVFDEARDTYSRARVGISWSSMNDLIARVFEFMAFGVVPVINRVPDLKLHFEEGVHYLGFDTVSEAVEKVKFALENPEISDTIIANAKKAVAPHSYDARIQQMLDTVFGDKHAS